MLWAFGLEKMTEVFSKYQRDLEKNIRWQFFRFKYQIRFSIIDFQTNIYFVYFHHEICNARNIYLSIKRMECVVNLYLHKPHIIMKYIRVDTWKKRTLSFIFQIMYYMKLVHTFYLILQYHLICCFEIISAN